VRLGAGPSSATLVNLHIVRRVALSQANIWSRCGNRRVTVVFEPPSNAAQMG
jgi:hypothetical protein